MSAGFSGRAAPHRARGGVYIAVLMTSLFVVIGGVGALFAVRARLERAVAADDLLDAQLAAQSGIELACLRIENDPNWRTPLASGTWRSGITVGASDVAVWGIDPNDGNVGNRPNDPVLLRAESEAGGARHTAQVEIAAAAAPIEALKFAIHTAGHFRVRSGVRLIARGAPVSTDLSLTNGGVIFGDVDAAGVDEAGAVSGRLSVNATVAPFPSADTAELYAGLGTVINPGASLSAVTLGPHSSPFGAADPDGVYVIRTSSDLKLDGVALQGTLVIIAPGRTVTIANTISLDPARADYPVLLVVGNVEFDAGAVAIPGLGAVAGIRGLVHTRGKVRFRADPRLTGVLLVESTASSEAIDVAADVAVRYNPALYENPPQWYAKSVAMRIQRGSWRRITE